MASVGAFVQMMGDFLGEMQNLFPDEKGITKFATQFDLLKSTNPRKCVETYMSGIAPYVGLVTSKDESLFQELEKSEYLKDLNLAKNWSSISEHSKGCIWQYLSTLYMLGTTIVSIPTETLAAIENIAKDCASKIEDGEGGLDQEALMKAMSNMLGGMMNPPQ